MPGKRRQLTPFSLSFLDIMSCGLGAVVLLFLIIKHNLDVHDSAALVAESPAVESQPLEEEIAAGKQELMEMENSLAHMGEQLAIAEKVAHRLQAQLREREDQVLPSTTEAASAEIAALHAQLQEVEQQKRQLMAEPQPRRAANVRAFTGEGQRQYLTGLKLGGERILILLDTSASMLDETLVNIIRRRNLPEQRRLVGALKWQQAVRIVDWLSAHFPPNSHYQIYTFNTEVKAVVPGTEGKWLPVKELPQLNRAIAQVRQIIPKEGTSLEKAFLALRKLQPWPDNVYLITDGLPTQGQKPPLFGTKVSGKERLKRFNEALKYLPERIPVNVLLLPLEGDPMAAYAFWGLAIQSQGSFISPAQDWP
jgi:hypothetical protein